jgi:hypothetical protein
MTWIAKDGQIYDEQDPKGRTLALIPYYDHEPEQDAQAALFAAAPDMLGALKGIQSLGWNDGPIPDAYRKEFEAIDAAIAKAEGRA